MTPFINIHTHHKPKSAGELIIRNAFLKLKPEQIEQLNYPVSVGLHPWHVNQMSIDECLDRLQRLVALPNVIAVGEIGIDRAIQTPVEIQVAYFEAQLHLAEKYKKPVIIHAVRSNSDLLYYLKKASVPFIFHQFTGNEIQVAELLRFNCKLSFGKKLFHPQNEALFRNLPDNAFFLETDIVSLPIADVYAKAAQIRNLPVEELKKQLFFIFAGIFKR